MQIVYNNQWVSAYESRSCKAGLQWGSGAFTKGGHVRKD